MDIFCSQKQINKTNNRRKTISVFCGLIGLLVVSQNSLAAGGLGFDKTRLYIHSGKTDGSLLLKNTSNNVYLVKARLEDFDQNPTRMGTVRPPIFQINPDKATRLRVLINAKDLPTDRESMFWLFTHAFPAQKVTDTKINQLQFNYLTRIKVFYRPSGLQGSLEAATEQVDWTVKNSKLVAKNQSPYNISLASLRVNGKLIDTSKVLTPYSNWASNISVQSSSKPVSISWSSINEFGGISTYEKILGE